MGNDEEQEKVSPTIDITEVDKDTILDDDIFSYIYSIKDDVARIQVIAKLHAKAKEFGIAKEFNDILKIYDEKFKGINNNTGNVMKYTNSPLEELKCGRWICTDEGIVKVVTDRMGIERNITICPHPLLPVELLHNIETNTEKIKLAYYKNHKWQYVTTDRSVVANKSTIIQLADRGIEVNSENAKDLVSFISEILGRNPTKIPILNSINRLGWIDEEFIPFNEEYRYDGDIAFKKLYDSLNTKGDYDKWKEECRNIRSNSKIAQLIMASSFASVLNTKLDSLPFIVHLWGRNWNRKNSSIDVRSKHLGKSKSR